jgi:hypothetical protein
MKARIPSWRCDSFRTVSLHRPTGAPQTARANLERLF